MKIVVDLSGLRTKEEILHKFGEIFEFGGPGGNIPPSSLTPEKGWGFNWDAMNDCFRYLDVGGILGTSKEFSFPLEIEISNYQEFKEANPEGFRVLKEILEDLPKAYEQDEKVIKVIFS